MKLCKDCKHFGRNVKGMICKYHVCHEEIASLVTGHVSIITRVKHNAPSMMRYGSAFTFRWWKNCGKKGKFWEEKDGNGSEDAKCL